MSLHTDKQRSGVWIALPVFNEERALGPLLDRFVKLSGQDLGLKGVIVVDDGSTDGSAAVLESYSRVLPIKVLRHPANLGLGETIQDALRAAAGEATPLDIVITMDADNTQPPELIPQMLAAVDAGNDVVIASRYRKSAAVSGLSAFRTLMSWGALFLFRALVPIRNVRDYTSGFRAYRAGALQRVLELHSGRLSEERGFACMAEILVKFGAAGVRIAEVPLLLRYEMKGGASKMNILATIQRTARVAWRNRFSASLREPQKRGDQPAGSTRQAGPPQ